MDLYLSLLESWCPVDVQNGRNLTIEPDWPASFTIKQFSALMDLISSPTENVLFSTATENNRGCTIATAITVNIWNWRNSPLHNMIPRQKRLDRENWFPQSRKRNLLQMNVGPRCQSDPLSVSLMWDIQF